MKQGKIRYYGVSVERIDEAKTAIEFPGVQSVMIIFNIFRQRPIEDFFPEANNGRWASSPAYPGLRPADRQDERHPLRAG